MNRKLFLRMLLVSALSSPFVSAGEDAAPKAPVRVLVLDGFSNHDWRHTTRRIRDILDAAGGFEVTVSTFPEAGPDREAWLPPFSKCDVVVQTCNDIGGGPRWPRAAEQALEDFVRGGGGMFVYHSGNNAFPAWEEYNRMIGLGWRKKDYGFAITVGDDGTLTRLPAGQGGSTGHGERINALLHRRGDAPIHRGLPREWRAADLEIYRYARGPAEELEVLSYARDPQTGLNFPVEWTVEYGRGRVYNSTFGHVWHDQKDPEGMRCAGFQTVMVRAVEWLAGREPRADVPADFPTAEKVSLR